MTERKLLYQRQLPGGGWVTLEAEAVEAGTRADEAMRAAEPAPTPVAEPEPMRRGEGAQAADAADPADDVADRAPLRVVLRVERRTDPTRRAGHAAPVIAQVVAPSETVAFDQLYPIAANNVQLAQRILRWQADRRGDGMMR